MSGVKILPEVSSPGLFKLLFQVRRDFPELKDWFIFIKYGNISTYARVNCNTYLIANLPVKIATVIINREQKDFTRRAIKGLIAHELVHILYIDSGFPHTEEDVASEILARGYRKAVDEMFLSVCKVFCFNQCRMNIGGIDCQYHCPHLRELMI